MELKEFKEKAQDKVVDIIVNLGVFGLSEIMDIEDIREAKESFDELSDLLNEYIKENDKPKFEVGDYVTYGICGEKLITKVTELEGIAAHGLWYNAVEKIINKDFWLIDREIATHSTDEEIAEYKAALQFHKHGRKPFEIKKGDLVLDKYCCKWLVSNTYIWDKEDFVSGRYTLLKKAEEVEAWLSDGQ